MRAFGRALPLLLLLPLAAAGCRHVGRPASGDAGEAYFPLVPESRWTYEIRSEIGRTQLEVRAVGERHLPSYGAVFVMEESTPEQVLGFARTAPVAYVRDDGYVARIAGLGYDSHGLLRSLGQDAPTWILPREPRDGEAWTQEHRLFGTPDADGGARMRWSGSVRVLPELRVPAGSFREVLEVRTTYRDPVTSAAPQVVYVDHYARGVGLVHSVTLDPAGEGRVVIEQWLLTYDLP